MAVLGWLYVAVVAVLALYGFNAVILALISLLARPQARRVPTPRCTWPRVTVQIPVYNEVHVIDRVIHAAARLHYPRDLLEIQVLDDSDDETTEVIAALVAQLERRGVNIKHYRRGTRAAYKAGALAYGLERATGELIAILDADFLPPPNWLQRVVPYLLAQPDLGFVQTRWEHLNAWASPVTLAQSLALDGHFAVEQAARQAVGWPVTFNGSAGVWRKACIVQAGNWQGDTLCEDLDLAYRAQLVGWKGLVITDVAVPAEVPVTVTAFRQQQARWAAGSVQTLRKLAGQVVRSPHLPMSGRWQALIHLSNYLVHPLLLLALLLSPLVLGGHPPLGWGLGLLAFASVGPPLVYTIGQWRLRRSLRRLWALPVLVLLGIGIAWACTKAILLALLNRPMPFQRTPKFRSVGRQRQWEDKRYGAVPRFAGMGEALWAAYAWAGTLWAWLAGKSYAAFFLGLYAVGFSFVALKLWQEREQHKRARYRYLARRTRTGPGAPALTRGGQHLSHS